MDHKDPMGVSSYSYANMLGGSGQVLGLQEAIPEETTPQTFGSPFTVQSRSRRASSDTISFAHGKASFEVDMGGDRWEPDKSKAIRAAWQRLPSVKVFGNNGFRLRGQDSKKLLAFIVLNTAFSVAEMIYGIATKRVALVSDAFHLSFGCGVLSLSLVAILYARKQPDQDYTYGYDRLDVLAGFTNALFLLFLSFSLAVEALHSFVQDESEHRHYLTMSAALNLVVNLMGVFFFRQYSRIYVVYYRPQDMNHHSIFLHVLADSLRSAGIILASWLLAIGMPYAETVVNILISASILLITRPLFYATSQILLQTVPAGMPSGALDKCLREAMLCEGAVSFSDAKFWSFVPGVVIGTTTVQARPGANEQQILQHVHSVFNNFGVADMTVQIETI